MIILLIVVLGAWYAVGGFEWVIDFGLFYKYDCIAAQCEYLLEQNINFETYATWRTSIIQTYELNRQVGIVGGPFHHIDEQAYHQMKFMLRTYQQEQDMYSFFKVYV